jgi:hypothetical protein
MNRHQIDPIVLGHNSFFGVNHLSKQQGAAREATFEDVSAIIAMMRAVESHGVSAMMMSTHPRATLVAQALKAEPELARRWSFYPLLPYITKYVRQSNEKGLVNVVLEQLKQAGLTQSLGLMARGGVGLFTRDYRRILSTLTELELAPFKGLPVKAVFLHDVLTDLALALDIPEVLELHMTEVHSRFGAVGAFATKNLPMLAERFRKYGFQKPLVLAHVNKLGFGANPSRSACEEILKRDDLDVMAMGTLASGYIRPAEAFEYVFSHPAVRSVVVGMSTPAQAAETIAAATKASAVLR